MDLKDQVFLENEYIRSHNQSVTHCNIGKEKIIVPASYEGNVEKFFDDVFEYETEQKRYTQYNSNVENKERIQAQLMKEGNFWFLAPFDLVILKIPPKEIHLIAVKRALKRYRQAVAKTRRACKEYPFQTFVTSLDEKYIKQLDEMHQRYITSKIKSYSKKGLCWTAKQPLQITAGVIGALPAAAYFLLDTKFHFADNGKHHFIKTKALPYIRKGLFKALLAGTLFTVCKDTTKTDNDSKKDKFTPVITTKSRNTSDHTSIFFNVAKQR